MRSSRVVSCLLLALIVGVVPAAAQTPSYPVSSRVPSSADQDASGGRPHTREGFWFSGGLGVGSLGCEDCDERETSLSADIAVGGTLSSRFLIGAGTSAWSKEEDGLTLTVATLEARMRFYPRAEAGFFLTGGLGLSTVRVGFDDFGDESENGLGVTLGLGWDVRVARNVSITPYWTGTAVRVDEANANFGSLGVAVTIH
jgi:hypothetical protein